MADISILSRLVNGIQRNVDISANTLVTTSIKVGGGVSNTELTKAILDNLVALQNGTDFATGTNAHTHDGRYYTETELGSQANGASGASKIGIDVTPAFSNFVSGNNVQSALEGIDTALASAGGLVKISAADTTAEYLNASITAGSGLSKSITNPGANEQLDLAVNVDDSTIEISSDALRVKDAGITNAKIATGIDAAKLADGSVSNTEFQYLDGVTSSIQTQINGKVSKSGDSMSSAANLTFSGGGEVLGLPATPSAAGAAASKAYVDAVALGLAPKKAVYVATTGPGTLASSFENGDTVDGVTLVTGMRILIKDQSTASENGIYTVNASGAPTRATDFDSLSPIDEINGAWVPVQFGTVNAGRVYVQYGTVATLGSDPINFEFYNPIASLIGGDMITVSGSTISIDLASGSGLESTNPGDSAGQLQIKLDGSTLSKSVSGLKVAALGITNAEISNSAAIAYSKLNLSSSIVNADIASGAAIAYSKLSLSNSIVNADIAAGAAIAYSKLNLSASIVNADIASGAAIAYSKLALTNSIVLGDLTSGSVDENKLTTSVAGAGLTGGGGAALAVGANADGSIIVNANDIQVAHAPAIKKTFIAGESFAANTSFAVRIALTGETAGRVYKADYDASVSDKFYAYGMVEGNGAAAKTAGDPIVVVMMGTITLGSSDSNFAAGEVGQAVHLKASGAWDAVSQITYAANQASYRLGMVQEVDKILVGNMQLLGIA